MKIQLDTTEKTIKIEEKVNLGEFIDALEKLLPVGLWRTFTIEVQVITNWSNPIIIRDHVWPDWRHPLYPQYPWITYCATGDNIQQQQQLQSGNYNIEF